jgi:hypothetical protein
MNRIILIGNGFDLAHGMKTSYKDFIDDFWEKEKKNIFACHKGKIDVDSVYVYENDIMKIHSPYTIDYILREQYKDANGYSWFMTILNSDYSGIVNNRNIKFRIWHKNDFLKTISEKCTIQNWVDVEEEYYSALNECLDYTTEEKIIQLNEEFTFIKNKLANYIKEQLANSISIFKKIEEKIHSPISHNDISKIAGIDTLQYILYLNFNYTNTEKLYIKDDGSEKIIHIHGELNNPENPIIFGYGDDIDDKYKLIEQKNNNKYLENIKSINYSKTRNYKEMLKFINLDNYQVYVMGHSCGISDKTLLNTLFEHKNCLSIKVYYHNIGDGTDNYSDIVSNISRNFTDKKLFRERIVPKEESESL